MKNEPQTKIKNEMKIKTETIINFKHQHGIKQHQSQTTASANKNKKKRLVLFCESRLETPSAKSDTWKHAGGAGEPTLRNVRRKDGCKTTRAH